MKSEPIKIRINACIIVESLLFVIFLYSLFYTLRMTRRTILAANNINMVIKEIYYCT